MKKIRREFAELMLNKTEGKMIEQLTVSNYYMEDVRTSHTVLMQEKE